MKSCLIFAFLSVAGATLAKDSEEKLPDDFTIPYLVYLQSSPEPCVGTLVHPQWVLTAAHCPIPAKIRLGVYQPSIKNVKEQVQNYSSIITHPEFDAQHLINDLRLIKLSKAALLNIYVGTIAVALEPMTFNESCFIPTWTWNEYKNLSDPDILTWINQHTIPEHECLDRCLQETDGQVTNILCMGRPLNIISEIKEVSAAPAICGGRLHGIFSWGKPGVTLGNEAFFTEIHHYARWIMKITNSH